MGRVVIQVECANLGLVRELLRRAGREIEQGRKSGGQISAPDWEYSFQVEEPFAGADVLNMMVHELGLGIRARKAALKLDVRTVGELCQKTPHQLLALKNMGRTTLKEIVDKLAARGLALSDNS